jgi:EAL domain-containing protein (putative c-di-GMP-specific phosphodiesterase class I)
MDSQIIAEGIETDTERQVCMELGLHYGQGYQIARPAPLETFKLGMAAAPSSALG